MQEKIKELCNNSSDLIIRTIKKNEIIIELYYLETLCDTETITNSILKPILSTNENINISLNNIITNPSIKKRINISDAINDLYQGNTILIVNNENIISVETKTSLDRGINEDVIEASLIGPKDAFTENINKNIGLIRKRIKNNELVVKNIILGTESNTKISICYMNNIVDKNLVYKVLKKLKQIKNDIIIDGGYIVSQLEKTKFFPEINQTERPDLATFALLEGKICILEDNSPTVLIAPTFFIDFFHTPDDYYQKNINTSFIRIIRFLAFLIAIFLPGYYISITTYNPTSIPTNLLLNLIEQHTKVPFPAFFEITIMIIAFEILRESDIRIPSKVGSSVSILGGLILGEAAVSAGIISPIMIIVVALSSISSLVFSYNSMINLIRYYRYLILFLSALLGIYGLFIGLTLLIINLSSITSFDYPYTYPLVPLIKSDLKDSLIKINNKNNKRNPLLTKKRDR